MSNLSIVDQPRETIQSVYSPIKFSARYQFSSTLTLSQAKETFPSCMVTIYPRNTYTNLLEHDKSVSIRVQPSIDIPNYEDDQTPNTSYVYYTIDVSSITRDFLSYDLRPCTHDTSDEVRRDITLGQISKNVFRAFKVQFDLEKINSSGQLVTLTGEVDSGNFTAVNAALLHEEEHYLSIGNLLFNGTSSQNQGDNLSLQYLHRTGGQYEMARQKYFTTKKQITEL